MATHLHFATHEDASFKKRRFTLQWTDTDGVFRHDLGKEGKRVGFSRGECFNADPNAVIARCAEMGHSVEVES